MSFNVLLRDKNGCACYDPQPSYLKSINIREASRGEKIYTVKVIRGHRKCEKQVHEKEK